MDVAYGDCVERCGSRIGWIFQRYIMDLFQVRRPIPGPLNGIHFDE